MEIRQGRIFAGKERLISHEFSQHVQTKPRPRQSGHDLRLVGGAALPRRAHALHIDVPDQRPVGVAVEDADDLVHPRPPHGIGRLKARPGEDVIDIAGDRRGFIELEAVMLESRNAAEGMPGEIAVGRAAGREDVDLLQPVGNLFLLQRQPHDAHVDAVGGAEDDGLAHGGQSANGSFTRMVSSRSGLVERSATGASISSSMRRMYLIAVAGSCAQERAPLVDSRQPSSVSYTGWAAACSAAPWGRWSYCAPPMR